MKWQIAFLVAPALALAACAGGDSGSDTATSADWCVLAQKVEDSSAAYEGSLDSGGEALGAAFEQFSTLFDEAKRAAPDQIKDAVQTSADGISKFGEVLGEVDYDLSSLDESALAELEAMGDEMDAASAEIEAYNERQCGITAGAVSDDAEQASADSPDSPDLPDLPTDPSSDWCAAARAVEDAGNPLDDVDFTDPEAVESAVTSMVGLFKGAVDVAPPELLDDVEISFRAIRDLEAVLADADWDLLEADLSMLEEDDQSAAAKANIAAYNEQVCGIAVDDEQDDSSDFDPQAGTISEQAISELVAAGFTEAEATCVFSNFDFNDPDAAEPDVIMDILAVCDIDLERLADLGG